MTDTGAPSTTAMPDAGFAASVPQDAAPPAAPTTPAFMDLVPAEYRDKPWIENFAKAEKPIEAFFKSYDSAQTMIGKKANAVEVPGEGATPEQIKAFHKALGVPETPEAYQYKAPDLSQEPEDVQKAFNSSVNSEGFKQLAQVAHEAGVTPAQFAKLTDAVNALGLGQIKSTAQAQVMAQEQALANFEKFYGNKDKADAAIRIGKETLQKIGMPKEVAEIGDQAALIWAMNLIHERLYSNDKVGTQNMGTPELTAQELQSKIWQAREKKDSDGRVIFEDKLHPQHKEHHAYVMSLYKELSALNG